MKQLLLQLLLYYILPLLSEAPLTCAGPVTYWNLWPGQPSRHFGPPLVLQDPRLRGLASHFHPIKCHVYTYGICLYRKHLSTIIISCVSMLANNIWYVNIYIYIYIGQYLTIPWIPTSESLLVGRHLPSTNQKQKTVCRCVCIQVRVAWKSLQIRTYKYLRTKSWAI